MSLDNFQGLRRLCHVTDSRYGLRNFECEFSYLSRPPTPLPLHSLVVRCCMASEYSCSVGPPPAPTLPALGGA